MSDKATDATSNSSSWKNEQARQRWELFHRAIAHAKQSNVAGLEQSEDIADKPERRRALLYVAK